MEIAFACPHCGGHFKAPSEFAGRRLKCPKCAVPITVTAATAATPPLSKKSASPEFPARAASPRIRRSNAPSSRPGRLWPWLAGVGAVLVLGLVVILVAKGFKFPGKPVFQAKEFVTSKGAPPNSARASVAIPEPSLNGPKPQPAPIKAVSGAVGLEVGDLAPEIEGEDLDGKRFKLSDYRGKVVVLDFWGNW